MKTILEHTGNRIKSTLFNEKRCFHPNKFFYGNSLQKTEGAYRPRPQKSAGESPTLKISGEDTDFQNGVIIDCGFLNAFVSITMTTAAPTMVIPATNAKIRRWRCRISKRVRYHRQPTNHYNTNSGRIRVDAATAQAYANLGYLAVAGWHNDTVL